MLTLGPIALTAPWFLTGLLVLPALWWLLRLMPPAPRQIPFPAIRFLFGLDREETTPRAAPWWLILMRLAIAAAVIVAASRPILNPDWTPTGTGPLVLVVDDGWASAAAWEDRRARATGFLDGADRADRPVVLVLGAAPPDGAPLEPATLMTAQGAREVLAALEPKPWPIDRLAMTNALTELSVGFTGTPETIWISNGLQEEGTQAFSEVLATLGPVQVFVPDGAQAPLVLSPPAREEAAMTVAVDRADASVTRQIAVVALTEDGRPLFRQEAVLEADQTHLDVVVDLPMELRNDVTRLSLEGGDGVGATVLLDARWSRKPIGILTDIGSREALPLLSEIYFLDRALQPLGSIERGPVESLLKAPQSVLLLPDQTVLAEGDAERLTAWTDAGGMLIRFAGPRLAAAVDDPMVPVPLRSGGRQLSGAMLWTEPARIGMPPPGSPFFGMAVPEEVQIARQVLAEPSLDLDRKTWLRLEDDTPLVTAERRGDGWMVLIHTTANTEWSDMALSGLFVDMLRRLSSLGQGVRDAAGDREMIMPYRTLDGFARLGAPQNAARPVAVEDLETIGLSAHTPPGFYGTQDVRVAVNLGNRVDPPAALELVDGIDLQTGFALGKEQNLAPYLLIAGFLLLILDSVLTVILRGYSLVSAQAVVNGWVLIVAIAMIPKLGVAQDGQAIPFAAQETVLAYVLTGDRKIDDVSAAGLAGLSEILQARTAVEAGQPVGVDIERDELAFYPLLYWPVVDGGGQFSAAAADRLNRFMAGGGVILFDTRDGHLAGGRLMSASTTLRQIARSLNVPPLAAVPPDHVMTRSFYLMQDFPGRWDGGTVWVETGASTTNDGVSPVIVGDADWAAAWAVDELGRPMFPIGDDGHQREMAYRFGVNLVMYTLTGNYKSDQVHVPSILERLGQ